MSTWAAAGLGFLPAVPVSCSTRLSGEKRNAFQKPRHPDIWFSALPSCLNKVTCCFQNQVKVNQGEGCFDKQTSLPLVNKKKRKKEKVKAKPCEEEQEWAACGTRADETLRQLVC